MRNHFDRGSRRTSRRSARSADSFGCGRRPTRPVGPRHRCCRRRFLDRSHQALVSREIERHARKPCCRRQQEWQVHHHAQRCQRRKSCVRRNCALDSIILNASLIEAQPLTELRLVNKNFIIPAPALRKIFVRQSREMMQRFVKRRSPPRLFLTSPHPSAPGV